MKFKQFFSYLPDLTTNKEGPNLHSTLSIFSLRHVILLRERLFGLPIFRELRLRRELSRTPVEAYLHCTLAQVSFN
jgi:hypothetical protein